MERQRFAAARGETRSASERVKAAGESRPVEREYPTPTRREVSVTLHPPGTALDRAALIRRYRANRERTARLFASFVPEAYYERPIPLRHPIVFYEGTSRRSPTTNCCARE